MMEPRWVFCCGMRRAGSTVQYQLTKDIVESLGVGKGVGAALPNDFPSLEERYRNESGFLVVKVHIYFPRAGALLEAGNGLGLYVYRDVRDVVASLMHKERRGFWTVASKREVVSLLEDGRGWRGHRNVLVSKYEIMADSLANEAMRIANHSGVEIPKSRAIDLVEKYSLQQQRDRIRSTDFNRTGVRAGRDVYDAESLLHANHIWSGAKLAWQKELTPLQIALVETWAGSWLVQNQYALSHFERWSALARLVYYAHFPWAVDLLRRVIRWYRLKNSG